MLNTFTNQDPGRSQLPSGQLERLLAEATGAQQDAPGKKTVLPTGKFHYLSYVRPSSGGHHESPSQLDFGSKTQRPNLDKLLFKVGSNRPPAKDPLSDMDGKIAFSPLFKEIIFQFSFLV